MRIGFYGGVREIGGNIILMESNGVGIVFDFGRRFPTSQVFFNDTIKGRPEKGFEDYVDLGEMPPFRGFYKRELPESKGLSIEIGGMFFSHAHLDHIGQICYQSDSLKKYMTRGTFATLSYFVDKGIVECMPENIEIIDGKTVEVGDFKITPYFIDHDVPGAVAYFVETPKGLVIYTGDIYFKGIKRDLSFKFVEYAKSLKPYILITEGTRIGWNGILSNTEDELKEQIKEVANIFKGLIIGNVYEIHLARIQTFFDASIELGKNFIIHEDYANTLLTSQIWRI
jgi:Predicted hydrolase of the metallo-beta-lactamase superfamily